MKQYIFALITLIVLSANAETDPYYRLNSVIYPSSYVVTIRPYFDTGDAREFTFDGEVSIVISTDEQNISQIKLHAEDLTFNADNITVTRDTTNVALSSSNPLYFEDNYNFAFINLETPLEAGVNYTLTITYTGLIRNDLYGFYRSYYVEQGVTK